MIPHVTQMTALRNQRNSKLINNLVKVIKNAVLQGDRYLAFEPSPEQWTYKDDLMTAFVEAGYKFDYRFIESVNQQWFTISGW